VLWQKKLNDDDIAGIGWTAMEFDNGFLHLEPGHKYYIALKTTSTKTYSYAYIGESSDKMTYRIWWSNADYAITDENGNYSFKVDRYSTGTLHAYSDGHEFNAISFTNLSGDATGKNFVEGGGVVIIDEPTSAEQFAAEQLKIWAAGRTIVVENANDEIRVYDVMGRLVGSDAARNFSATITVNNSGIYIVKVGSEAQRVMVK
jgi:hypothetical protein